MKRAVLSADHDIEYPHCVNGRMRDATVTPDAERSLRQVTADYALRIHAAWRDGDVMDSGGRVAAIVPLLDELLAVAKSKR